MPRKTLIPRALVFFIELKSSGYLVLEASVPVACPRHLLQARRGSADRRVV